MGGGSDGLVSRAVLPCAGADMRGSRRVVAGVANADNEPVGRSSGTLRWFDETGRMENSHAVPCQIKTLLVQQ